MRIILDYCHINYYFGMTSSLESIEVAISINFHFSQPSSRVEKIYVKTSFNIPLSVNQLENKIVVTTVITMLRFTDNSVRGR
jgi:hypothetical protein